MRDVSMLTLGPHASLKQAMRVIDRGGVRSALLVDEEGRLQSVVRDRSLRAALFSGAAASTPVSSIVHPESPAVQRGTDEEEIRRVVGQQGVGSVPVVDEKGRPEDFVVLLPSGEVRSFCDGDTGGTCLSNVLVIGGAGYIGSILVRKLLERGSDVVVFDRFLYGSGPLEDVADDPKLTVVEGDTRHIEDVTAVLGGVDAVVHLGEVVGDPACALYPSITQGINYFATSAIANICKHFQINRFVYASSCSVYGASNSADLLTESSPFNPVSLYAKMKIASENALMEACDENFVPTILRLSTVFGFSYRPRFDLIVNLLTAKAMQEGKITIFGGDQWRPNVHVADVADTILRLL